MYYTEYSLWRVGNGLSWWILHASPGLADYLQLKMSYFTQHYWPELDHINKTQLQ